MVKPSLGVCVIARSHLGRIDVLFGPLVTTEAHLAFSGAGAHCNNTAKMTVMIEALSFLGPHGPVARDELSCIYHDSQHAAVCLFVHDPGSYTCAAGTPMSTVHDIDQHKLRLTMQHVFGHSGNLVECADHAAAFATCGLTSLDS